MTYDYRAMAKKTAPLVGIDLGIDIGTKVVTADDDDGIWLVQPTMRTQFPVISDGWKSMPVDGRWEKVFTKNKWTVAFDGACFFAFFNSFGREMGLDSLGSLAGSGTAEPFATWTALKRFIDRTQAQMDRAPF